MGRLDSVEKEHKQEIRQLKEEISDLKTENKLLREENQILRENNARLKSIINNDSSNTSLPQTKKAESPPIPSAEEKRHKENQELSKT